MPRASSLADVLPRADPARFRRYTAALEDVERDHDHVLGESLKKRLVAKPRGGGPEIHARMSVMNPDVVYTLVAGGREIEVVRAKASGCGVAHCDRYRFEMREHRTRVA